MATHTRTHVYVGYANRFLTCTECGKPVKYWHDPDRCGCDAEWFLYPCEHKADTKSLCSDWNPVDNCHCGAKGKH